MDFKEEKRGNMTNRKVALVTAAAGAGIGAAISWQLAEDGFAVVITDAHERRCGELAAELGEKYGREFLSLPLDVTDFEAVGIVVEEVLKQYGRLDVLVNNAGWNKLEPVAEMSPETWQHCLDVDLNGTFNCIRHVLPEMIKRTSGPEVPSAVIINISSIAAWETSTEHGAAYSAAKAGILALTRVAAAENGKHGIRINAVSPGLIYNDFLRRIYPDEFFEGYAENRSLVGRVGQPQDVADMVSYLVSDKAGYITGEVFTVSGGVSPHA
jgi:3-oxoacyl-[acyl-carrier protein] reductase